MNFTASIRRIPLLVFVLTVSQSAYGQESLPETVVRHEKEIINLRQKIDQLESALKSLEGQGMVGSRGSETFAKTVYFIPVKNTSECDVIEANVSYGDTQSSLMAVAKFNAESDNVPYSVNVRLDCPLVGYFGCNTFGLVNLGTREAYGFQVERTGNQSCIINSVEVQ